MRRAPMQAAALLLIAALAPPPAAAGAASPAATPPGEARPEGGVKVADASTLFNLGTDALSRGDLGPAVAWLTAARRIDPRASDIARNLDVASARAAALRGDAPERAEAAGPLVPSLSASETWWLAAVLLALGALLGGAAAIGGRGRLMTAAGVLLLAVGAALWGASTLRAREEALHPEAVVVVPVLSVGPAPDERPRLPYLIGAGETVRVGRERGDLLEVRVGGNAAGWASSAGLWRVRDCAGYTPSPVARGGKEPAGG